MNKGNLHLRVEKYRAKYTCIPTGIRHTLIQHINVKEKLLCSCPAIHTHVKYIWGVSYKRKTGSSPSAIIIWTEKSICGPPCKTSGRRPELI